MLSELAVSVDSLVRVSVGRRVEIDAGYRRTFGDNTYAFAAVLEFESAAGLVEYLNHPGHAALGALFWRFCKRSVVNEVETLSLSEL